MSKALAEVVTPGPHTALKPGPCLCPGLLAPYAVVSAELAAKQ
jgi:hypothetical protein